MRRCTRQLEVLLRLRFLAHHWFERVVLSLRGARPTWWSFAVWLGFFRVNLVGNCVCACNCNFPCIPDLLPPFTRDFPWAIGHALVRLGITTAQINAKNVGGHVMEELAHTGDLHLGSALRAVVAHKGKLSNAVLGIGSKTRTAIKRTRRTI